MFGSAGGVNVGKGVGEAVDVGGIGVGGSGVAVAAAVAALAAASSGEMGANAGSSVGVCTTIATGGGSVSVADGVATTTLDAAAVIVPGRSGVTVAGDKGAQPAAAIISSSISQRRLAPLTRNHSHSPAGKRKSDAPTLSRYGNHHLCQRADLRLERC